MTPAARLAAAIDVLATIDRDRQPAAAALKAWGTAHRFAGSGDRAAIAGLVYDVLRRNASSAYLMGDDSARARALGMLKLERQFDVEAIAALCDGSRFAPPPLTEAERNALVSGSLAGAPAPVAGDYPAWLDEQLANAFGDGRAAEAAAMASRAPLDLRVNTLKCTPEAMRASLAHLGASPTPWSPFGLRIGLGADARNPGIHAETDFLKGHIEVQDEGSQLAALFTAPKPGEQVVDLCAGAGGKTLALAALMQGKGRIVATDADKRQLAPIHARLARAGAHNVEVRAPKGAADPLADLAGGADLVVVDAPCTGTGTWRRNPDAKWRMRPGALDLRLKDQALVLARAAALLRPGGRLAYITCSVLEAENAAQVAAFRARHPEFSPATPAEIAAPLGSRAAAFLDAVRITPEGLLMTPRRTGTDGFFVAVLRRQP
ncbi:MAG: RsmB/NOP family class I SAM-dependent RNA methyltransferase [Xanthobacteraceae bacterium]